MQDLAAQKRLIKKSSIIYFLLSFGILALGVYGLITGTFYIPSRYSYDWKQIDGWSTYIMFLGFLSWTLGTMSIGLYFISSTSNTKRYKFFSVLAIAMGLIFFICAYLVEIIKLANIHT